MSDWQKEIGAITLFVEDPDRARSFYEKVFELQPMHEDENDVMFRRTRMAMSGRSRRNFRTRRLDAKPCLT